MWGLGQVPTGWLADRVGRRWPITAGTFLIGAGIAVIASGHALTVWYLGAIVMGAGMALAYPNLITAVADSAHPAWRGGALGVYRLWRDSGYALGPLVLGAIAALAGISAALWVGAALLGASTLVLVLFLRETQPDRRATAPPWQDHPEWVSGQAAAPPPPQATR